MVFCHLCVTALVKRAVKWNKGEVAFVSKGYCNWKDAIVAFGKHEGSDCHKSAIEAVTLPIQCKDIAEQLSKQIASDKLDNRRCLLKIVSNVRYLARQGLAFRGNGDETNSNLLQLIKLRQDEDPRMKCWIERKTDKYTAHDMQNEMIKAMAFSVLQSLGKDIQSSDFFTVMCDECTDSSQLSVCIRWIDSQFEPQEDFIGLFKMDNVSATDIIKAMKETLENMKLSLSNCRGQCYNGASTMSGPKKGVAKLISVDTVEQPKAIYTHCYGHALNLSAGDTIKRCEIMEDALDIVFEASKLIKYSLKRDVKFVEAKLGT